MVGEIDEKPVSFLALEGFFESGKEQPRDRSVIHSGVFRAEIS
jgi:hypothetical protein